MNKVKKICCICSHGGHFHELQEAVNGVEGNLYWVTYKTKHTASELADKKHYFVIDPHTNKAMFFVNAVQSIWHLLRERPDAVMSTGAGIAIPTMIMAKYLLRAKIIYIESAACVVKPSKTGSFIYKYSDLFLIQWEGLKEFYPNAVYTGVL